MVGIGGGVRADDRLLLGDPLPDAPAGRYEYQFLVEGERWVTDPLAVSRRPDGFGYQNAVVNL